MVLTAGDQDSRFAGEVPRPGWEMPERGLWVMDYMRKDQMLLAMIILLE